MIKSETGTVSMRGTTPVLVSELAFMVKGMRESFAKEYGESAAEELISRASSECNPCPLSEPLGTVVLT